MESGKKRAEPEREPDGIRNTLQEAVAATPEGNETVSGTFSGSERSEDTGES